MSAVALTGASRGRGAALALGYGAFAASLAAVFAVPAVSANAFEFPAVEHGASLLPFAVLFALPLIDARRPLCWAHADVLALLLPLVGLLCTRPQRPWAIFVVYVALAYVVLRGLAIARRASAGAARTATRSHGWLPGWLLLVGIGVLVGAHLAWALTSGTSTDAGAGTVRGALRLVHGEALYSAGAGGHSDTYGPLTYEAYMPFVLLFDGHAAEHLAPLFYDLLAAGLLYALGRRRRDTRAGVVLAFCWLAFPLSFYAEVFGFTDPVVAAALVALLLADAHPRRAGSALAVAGWAKFSPFALLPLALARRDLAGVGATDGRRPRAALLFSASLIAASVVIVIPALLGSTPARFFADTLGYQLRREPANSMWSVLQNVYASGSPWVGVASRLGHAIVLALSGGLVLFAARVTRRSSFASSAGVGAAVLACVIFSDSYFSYNYLLWIVPMLLCVVVLAPAAVAGGAVGRRAGVGASAGRRTYAGLRLR